MEGTVEWFNNVEGYGVIDADDESRDVTVEFSDIESEVFPSLEAGDRVEFEVDERHDGLYARRVDRVGSAAPESPPSE